MNSGQWSSRSLGSEFKHRIFYAMIRHLGLWAAYPCLYAVALYYSLLPSVRQRSAPYLRRRFPGAGAFKLCLLAFRLNLSFALVLLERAAMGITGKMRFSDPYGGEGLVRELLAEGRGLIVVSAHVGAWQTGLGWLDSIDVPLNIVQRREETDVDRHYFEHQSKGRAPKIIDSREPAPALAAMTSALMAGEIVCLMGDRVSREESLTVKLPFLGDDIVIPGVPFYVANAVGAPIAVVFTGREGPSKVWGRVWKVIRPQSGRAAKNPETFKVSASLYIQCLEEYAAAEPFQFFNFYNLWNIGEEDGNQK